jgi:glycolate oxidase iron-sulfur subunit
VVRLCNEHRLPLTVHDSCHLKKGLGVFREPRALIEATDGYRLVEMAEADACSGRGGSFNLQHHDISSRIGRLKREPIRATGCVLLATGCPAGMLQISEALSKAGDRIAVRHPVEIYAETIDP